MADVNKPVTLADLDRDGKLAWVYCNACGRERDRRPSSRGLPMETPVPEAGKRLVCSDCGDRSVSEKLCNRGGRRRAGRAIASD